MTDAPAGPPLGLAARSAQGEKYAELHCHSYFSLLDGASSPEALVAQAAALGLSALALTDHDSLAGAVRFWRAAQTHGLHAVLGAEVTLADGYHLTLLAETQAGYANLCQLVSAARLDQLSATEPICAENWPGKVEPALSWERLAEHSAGLIGLSGCRQGPVAAPLCRGDLAGAVSAAGRLSDLFGSDHLYLEVQQLGLPDDRILLDGLAAVAQRTGLPVVASHNVHHATPDGRLRDVLSAVRHNQSLAEARRAGVLPLNHCASLQSPVAMAQRFARLPAALQATTEIAQRCQVSLDLSHKRLPHFPTPDGVSEFAYLYQLCHDQLPHRYPRLTPAVLTQLAHELAIIERAELAGYFLLVWDICRFARESGIRYQGRGSAANSIVAYLLGITAIDPLAHHLLFERFLAEDRFTMPDIDIDFAADRREQVIAYVYQRFGRSHAAMACNLVTYRSRSALRDLGKALDLPQETFDPLVHGLEHYDPLPAADELAQRLPADAPTHHPLRLLVELLRQIDGCPRHLSIHSGGMVITGPPLDQVVPLEPATMPGRIVVQWDKDSLEDAGLIKLDLLALRTLGLVEEACTLIEASGTAPPDLTALALDDPALYALLQQGDTIGTFQVESRAQQQMLPRLKPACFEDIIVEIAILRPGPIQGGAVHPYLRRRKGLTSPPCGTQWGEGETEAVSYLHPCLEPVLAETLGVLLFQEQAIKVAMVAGGFSAGEADTLRRAFSRSRPAEEMARLQARFVAGAAGKGIDPDSAAHIFAQLSDFAGYGFCKSHSASFALIAYQTLYLKHYHAPAFYAALLNQQPMGFYSSEVILGDARRYGVDLLPPNVNLSDWRYTLEGNKLRGGLMAVAELGEAGWQRLAQARGEGVFADLADPVRRSRLPRDTLQALIRAGALDSLGERRDLLWRLGELHLPEGGLEMALPASEVELPALALWEQTVWEYELLGYAPGTQVMVHYREELRDAGVLSTWQVKQARAGQRVTMAGMSVVRQRPGTAKGMVFVSLEDESGLLDLVIRPDVYAKVRTTLRGHPLLVVTGLVQRAGAATNVLVQTVAPLSDRVFTDPPIASPLWETPLDGGRN